MSDADRDPMARLTSVAAGDRSRLQEAWVGFVTVVRREVQRVLRIWPQTLLPPVITTSLYFVIFGPVLGDRIGEMEGFFQWGDCANVVVFGVAGIGLL